MCFDVQTKLETQLKRAKRENNIDWIKELEKSFPPYSPQNFFHVAAIVHPTLLIYTNEAPYNPYPASWGLVPSWIEDGIQKNRIRSSTVNARCETMYEKLAFKKAAYSQHCILPVDGFFEHYYKKGKTFPYYIFPINGQPLNLAGIWDRWIDPKTGETLSSFSIITTKANNLMQGIHNNPKLSESRMPVILSEENANKWLNNPSELEAQALLLPFPDGQLDAHTVKPIRGKKALGNVEQVTKKHQYEELRENLTLF